MKIYRYIYFYYYLQSKKVNGSPAIPVFALLTFVQLNNIIMLLNICLIILDINLGNYLTRFYLVLPPFVFYWNYYYFQKRGYGKLTIENKNYDLGKFSFVLDIFNVTSILLVAVTFYFYNKK